MLSRTKMTAFVFGTTLAVLAAGFVGCGEDKGLESSPPPPPMAVFSANPVSGTAPLRVTFSNSSTGEITGCSWDFGNGSTASCTSPTITFTEPGVYTVGLTVTGPGGSDMTSRVITVDRLQSAEFLRSMFP